MIKTLLLFVLSLTKQKFTVALYYVLMFGTVVGHLLANLGCDTVFYPFLYVTQDRLCHCVKVVHL